MLLVDAILGGCYMPYNRIDEFEKQKLGYWTGGFHDEWTWDDQALKSLSVEKLKEIYLSFKKHEI